MFLEDGNEIKQCMQLCVDKYQKDNAIFSKAIQSIHLFANQVEWPHNFSVMENVVSSILGSDLKTVYRVQTISFI